MFFFRNRLGMIDAIVVMFFNLFLYDWRRGYCLCWRSWLFFFLFLASAV